MVSPSRHPSGIAKCRKSLLLPFSEVDRQEEERLTQKVRKELRRWSALEPSSATPKSFTKIAWPSIETPLRDESFSPLDLYRHITKASTSNQEQR
jgi:hypothetical protein